ncbi:hypothetical protein SELMODRAFT_411891 [Selaginella moellendorffii]|uniref:Uncharacterized protein n=1 Tax=Selaginella moellendorffii TaxID=88036 RepID=D8RJD1_SELML|nr:hypothetical protein SELMODRAFT_411891 [Selaginella moellendorffii]
MGRLTGRFGNAPWFANGPDKEKGEWKDAKEAGRAGCRTVAESPSCRRGPEHHNHIFSFHAICIETLQHIHTSKPLLLVDACLSIPTKEHPRIQTLGFLSLPGLTEAPVNIPGEISSNSDGRDGQSESLERKKCDDSSPKDHTHLI